VPALALRTDGLRLLTIGSACNTFSFVFFFFIIIYIPSFPFSRSHVAQNSRLPPYKLSPAEAKCFNAHLDQARPYLSARNFVLSLWFANCYKEVSDDASLLLLN
jgi:hypothetical protein